MKKDQRWGITVWSNGVAFCHGGTGPVELMTEACRLAGVVWKYPKFKDIFYSETDKWLKVENPRGVCCFRPVIPAEPEPCPNCQDVKPGKAVRYFVVGGTCMICGRPQSEWTFAKPELEPCPNCQDVQRGIGVDSYRDSHMEPFVCEVCGRPESEWTFARDKTDDPERWVGGVI